MIFHCTQEVFQKILFATLGQNFALLGKCKKWVKCPSLLQKIRSSAGNLDEHATWYQWEHVEQMVQAKKGKSMKGKENSESSERGYC